jgi:hypothetical protein
MTIEEAIKKAYPNQKEMFSPNWGIERYLLLPDFWRFARQISGVAGPLGCL